MIPEVDVVVPVEAREARAAAAVLRSAASGVLPTPIDSPRGFDTFEAAAARFDRLTRVMPVGRAGVARMPEMEARLTLVALRVAAPAAPGFPGLLPGDGDRLHRLIAHIEHGLGALRA